MSFNNNLLPFDMNYPQHNNHHNDHNTNNDHNNNNNHDNDSNSDNKEEFRGGGGGRGSGGRGGGISYMGGPFGGRVGSGLHYNYPYRYGLSYPSYPSYSLDYYPTYVVPSSVSSKCEANQYQVCNTKGNCFCLDTDKIDLKITPK